MKSFHIFLTVVLILIPCVIGIIIGIIIGPYFLFQIFANSMKVNVTNVTECEGLNLERTSKCLNDFVRGFFYYTPTEDSEKPTLEELIKNGGDCKDYAEFYTSAGKELGFNSKYVHFKYTEGYHHAFAVLSDETGYCILDQNRIQCFEFAE